MGFKKDSATTRKINREIELRDIFVDRDEQKLVFKRHVFEMGNSGLNENGMLLFYSGVGGIGKTALFKELENIAEKTFIDNCEKFKRKMVTIRYDFMDDSTNVVGTLKALRKKLSDKHQIEFPLFDKGCIYLAQKNGEFITSEQKKAVLESTSLFRSSKKNFSSISAKNNTMAGTAKIIQPFLKDADDELLEFFQALAQGTLEASLVLKFAKPMLDFIDKKKARSEEEARKNGNEDYKAVADELEERNKKNNQAYIKEFLPTLFAKDLSFWLEKNKTDLIIFLDTYEVLTDENNSNKKTVRLLSENRDVPVDWWVGELLTADHVMWVIAGRHAINRIGEINLNSGGQVINYTVEAFDEYWSNKYLEKLGIEEDAIRDKIIKVTGGHPFYLGQCFITYDNKRQEGEVPRLSDFGDNMEEIVERAVGSFDDNDRLILQKLCILNRWTDEIAASVISVWNPNTYKRLTKLFAKKSIMDSDDGKLIVYTFDRTLDFVLFSGLKKDALFKIIFAEICSAANNYFKAFFDKNHKNNYDSDNKETHYFNIWSNIVLRTTDAADKLMLLYEENFAPLEKHFDNSTKANVVKKFLNKVNDTQPLPHAYFQDRLGKIRLSQNRIKEALELEEAAYSKIKDLPLSESERPFKFVIMNGLADVLEKLERYIDEINLRKEIVRECENCFLPKDDKNIMAKKNLAAALERGDKTKDAFEIRRQILELVDGREDEQYIDAVTEFAFSLKNNGKNEAALPLRRKIIAFYENKNDDLKLAEAFQNLIYTLSSIIVNSPHKKYFEEKAMCYRRYIKLCEKTGHRVIFYELEDFVATLKKLGCDEEAAKVLEIPDYRIADLERRIESFDNPEKETVRLILELIDLLYSDMKDEEAKHWENKIKEVINVIVEQLCCEPIKDYDATLSELSSLENLLTTSSFLVILEKIELRRKILIVTEEKPDVEEKEIIAAKQSLLSLLSWFYSEGGCFDDEVDARNIAEIEQLFEEIAEYFRNKLPDSRKELLSTLRAHAEFLKNKLHDYVAAVEKLEEMVILLEKDSETPAKEILNTLNDIVRIFSLEKNYSEKLRWLERIQTFCQIHFVEDAPENLAALENLISAYENVEDYDRIEYYKRKLIEIIEKNRGASHLDTISEKESLADILHHAGKYDDEIKLREEIIELYRDNFGANAQNKEDCHESFIYALESLSNILDETGKVKKAFNVRKEIAVEQKKRLQEFKEYPDFAKDLVERLIGLQMIIVARALQDVGDYDEELCYLNKIVDFCRAKNPHPKFRDTLKAMKNLAEAYSRYEQEDKALEVYKQLAENYGEDCPLEILDKIGDKEKADAVRRKIITDTRRFIDKNRATLGETNKEIIEARKLIAFRLEELGEYEGALTERQEILRLLNKEEYPNSQAIFSEETQLAELLVKMGKYDSSTLKTLSKNCDLIMAEGGTVGDLPKRIADAFEIQGDYEQALAWRRKIVEQKYSASAICELADTLDKLNLHNEATAERIQLLEKFNAWFEKIIDIYGSDSAKTKLTLKKLSKISGKISGDAQALETFNRLFSAYGIAKNDYEK